MRDRSSILSSLLDDNLRKGLALIRDKVGEMGRLAAQAVAASLTALTTADRRLAHAIILKDDRIDELEKQIDRLCLEFLVRQQPVGGHLRFIFSCTKINTELERIGDYAESVARHVLDLSVLPPHPAVGLLRPIAELATRMLEEAIDAFLREDPDAARATTGLEDQVDELRTDIRRQLLDLHRAGEMSSDILIPLAVVTARYERVADQAVNICEEVLYTYTGAVEKHKGAEAFRVLFLDRNCTTGIMAEGIASALGRSPFVFSSASVSGGHADARAAEFLAEKGIDASRLVCHSVSQIPHLEHYQVAILLGDGLEDAARCLPAKCVRVRWRPPEPPATGQPPEAARAEYEKLFAHLDGNIRDFVEAIVSNEIYP